MLSNHLYALLFTLVVYCILSLSYYGWGRIILNIFNIKYEKKFIISGYIWIGWAITLAFLQFIYIFYPIQWFVVLPLFLIGFIYSICSLEFKNINIKFSLNSIVLLIFVLWIISRSMYFPEQVDSGLYHFNKIKWINSYSAIYGLGNLHGRFAFNQSFFTYVASLNFYPFFNQGRSLANSFLFVLTVFTFLELLKPIFKNFRLIYIEHPFKYLSIILIFPLLGYLALTSRGLASPSPDLTITLIQLVLFVFLLRFILNFKILNEENKFYTIILTILSVTAITIKLSGIVFSFLILLYILVYTINNKQKELFLKLLIISFLILSVWLFLGFVFSGAPLYPSTIGYIDTLWSVPKDKVIMEAKYVYTWARQPGDPNIVLANWNWLYFWLDRLLLSVNLVNVVYPIVITSLFVFIIKFKMIKNIEWSVLLLLFISILFWFFTAPDPRFAVAIIHLLLVTSSLLFIIHLKQILVQNHRKAIFVVLFIASANNFVGISYFLFKKNRLAEISYNGWHKICNIKMIQKQTISGLKIYVTKDKDLLPWDSKIPSTVYFNRHLRLIEKDNINSGFTVK